MAEPIVPKRVPPEPSPAELRKTQLALDVRGDDEKLDAKKERRNEEFDPRQVNPGEGFGLVEAKTSEKAEVAPQPQSPASVIASLADSMAKRIVELEAELRELRGQ